MHCSKAQPDVEISFNRRLCLMKSRHRRTVTGQPRLAGFIAADFNEPKVVRSAE